MYYYSTVNGIIMTHSALLEKDGFDIVKVHFERPNDDGFDFLDMTLPGEIVYKSFGFSEDENIEIKTICKEQFVIDLGFCSERRRRKCLKRCLISWGINFSFGQMKCRTATCACVQGKANFKCNKILDYSRWN